MGQVLLGQDTSECEMQQKNCLGWSKDDGSDLGDSFCSGKYYVDEYSTTCFISDRVKYLTTAVGAFVIQKDWE